MSEYENMINKLVLTDRTKIAYKYAYKKLTDALEANIGQSTEKNILNTIPEISKSINTQSSFLNIAILIFKSIDKNHDKLLNQREKNKIEIQTKKDMGNEQKLKDLPTFKTLELNLEKLYVNKQYQEFIINYILLKLGVRNKDLNLLIVRKKKDTNKTDNFLIVRGTDILLLRQDYKTVKSYGKKENAIKSDKFRKAVLELLKENDNMTPTPLLKKSNGSRIGEDSLFNYITSRTYNNISESDILKVQLEHINQMGNLNKLNSLSRNRGTNVATLVNDYNLTKFELE